MSGGRSNWRYRALMITTALGLGFIPGLAFSQSATVSSNTNAQNGGLDEVVVTARRSSERAQDVPIPITTVTAQDIQDLAIRDVVDVQRVTPGLFVSTVQVAGRAKLTIRGQAEVDDKLTADRSVGVYVDGVSLEHQYGLRASMVDVAQVEVLRGPQGTLFGRNTTGGALNITTNHPVYEEEGYFDGVYGSYNNVQLLGVVNAPLIDDKLALRIVGQRISREGFWQEADGHDSVTDNSWNARVLLRADPTENVSILLSGSYLRQRNGDPHLVLTNDSMLANANTATGALGSIARYLGLNNASATDRQTAYNAWRVYYDNYQTGGYDRGYSAARDPHDDLDLYGASLNVSVDFWGATLRSITSLRRLSREYQIDLDATPFDLFISRQFTRAENFSQELQLSSIDGEGLDWQAGVFYNREFGNEFGASDTFLNVNSGRSGITQNSLVNMSRAIYAQGVLNVSPTFRVTAGARYTEDHREINNQNRIDLSLAILPLPAGGASRCGDLAPALGGPVFPNCNYRVGADFSKTNWLLGVDWRPAENFMVYGSVSTGYRSGGFTVPGTGVLATVAARDAAFTPYLPEELTNYEIGFKSDLFDRRLRVNASLFNQDYKNVQQRIRDQVNGLLVTLVRNAAAATLYGGEIELTAAPTDRLTLNAGISYLNASFDEFLARDAAGNLLDLTSQPFAAPELSYNLGAEYEIPLSNGALRFVGNYAWVDDVNNAPGTPDAASVTTQAHGLLDGRIAWTIDSADLEISLFGKNLTDEYYWATALNTQSAGWNLGIPGDPRTFGIQLRKGF